MKIIYVAHHRVIVRKYIDVVSEQSNVLQVFCTESGRKTKKKILRGLVAKFPELRIFYEREMHNKNNYYVKLLEAVGMAGLYDS